MDIIALLSQIWQYLVAAATLFISIAASAHAILHKRDSRAAVLWVGVIWLVPIIGGALYLLFGVNRIRRLAATLRAEADRYESPEGALSPAPVEDLLEREAEHFRTLATLVEQAVSRPLLPGNRIEPLINGDEAYPRMLQAIDDAKTSISLSTYIFDNDRAGRMFLERLRNAVERGVKVRVLIDDTGARYSWPSIVSSLRRAGVPVAQFLPNFSPTRVMTLNLRNHRKILVTDGRLGFTGGMNIREGNLVRERPSHPVQDIQFEVEGPVVAQLQETFADDWKFCTKESLRGDEWFPRLEGRGTVVARGVPDGPDEDFEKLRLALLGALSCARRSVKIMTPYFLPDPTMISALNLAAMRGVAVDILLPAKNNLPFVHWATCALLWQVLARGCRIWLSPPPFDHSKIMLVDGYWSLIGSANWDPRSLRLNFEFNVECYGRTLAAALDRIFMAKLQQSRRVTLAEMDGRSLPVRLRDGIARLFLPLL